MFCSGADCASNLVLIYHKNLKNYTETAPSSDDIWDEFGKEH